MWFEVLKRFKVEDEVKCKGAERKLKKFLQNAEVDQLRIFIGMEIGRGMCKNDILLIMNKDCKDKGCDWVTENHGVTFKFKQEKTHDSIIHAMTEKFMETAKEVQSQVIN